MCYRSVQLGISKDYSHFESPEFFGCSKKNLADCSQNLADLATTVGCWNKVDSMCSK